ncbi:MAG: hypothetical protein HFH86_00995 [Bacilli bacterium]|nr:hypothetical protein [Bacilli bacterium]
MKVISLSKRKFKDLTPLELSKEVINTEAKMYQLIYKGQILIFKKLYQKTGKTFANKLYTVEMLSWHQKDLPFNFINPEYLVSVGGEIEGLALKKVSGIPFSTLLNNKKIEPSLILTFMKKIGEILNQLSCIRNTTALKDIYINDLHDSNFLVNPKTGEIFVIDLDSCKIGHNISFPSRFLISCDLIQNAVGKYQIIKEDYELSYVEANENTDLYCYIILILNYFYGNPVYHWNIEEFYEYLNYLEYIGMSRELIYCISLIITNKKNENPQHLLDTVTNEQVYRANKTVYQRILRK